MLAVLVLVSVVAVATSTAAQAAPLWKSNGTMIPAGSPVTVKTKSQGTLEFEPSSYTQFMEETFAGAAEAIEVCYVTWPVPPLSNRVKRAACIKAGVKNFCKAELIGEYGSSGPFGPYGATLLAAEEACFHIALIEPDAMCKVKDQEILENPTGGGAGTDHVTSFNTKCTPVDEACFRADAAYNFANEKIEVIANVPWTSVLVAGSPVIDEIKNVQFEFRCHGVTLDTYKGNLKPEVGNSVYDFSSGSSVLEDKVGNQIELTGVDKIKGPSGDAKITAA